MFPHSMPPHNYQPYYPPVMSVPLPVANPGPEPLRPSTCYMVVRQQPREALVTIKGKEKFRKPVDPPPIIQLKLANDSDPSNHYLQNPYIFVSVSLYKPDRDEPVEHTPNDSLAGTLVSSLHRLKDVDNKDGGFFVFGDISVKIQGSYRLHFTMYEFQPSSSEFQFLNSATSERFDVVLPKDFKGLEESTYLSRAFSDQGVRLRLRKEARGMMSNKRGYPTDTESTSQAPIAPSYEFQSSKRRKEDYIDSPVTPSSAPRMNSISFGSMPPSIGSNAPLMTPFQSNPYAPVTSFEQPQEQMRPQIDQHHLQNYYSAPSVHARLPQPPHHSAYAAYNPMPYPQPRQQTAQDLYPMVPNTFDHHEDGSWDDSKT
ncbi:uncharacterized protein ALTATR162_LOCUS860 [Alternaria atra]|uniref:Velvet domain-containing protein n=1 Tax=Alternaria atra TaxID=119953 RepID=A0A8J2HT78_9PLEO|nr:uncharacterized protein ALTATR162_LOCUS860 [Alternaria atra]CAG5141084.1 unnamed protein product [Alternaria atra]